MATIVTFVSDGTTTKYTFPFDYLRREFVTVLVEGTAANFTLSNTHEVTLETAPVSGKVIVVKRVTDTSTLVDFIDGSVLLANDLNVSALQSLHIAAEALDAAGASLTVQEDGSYSAGFRRIAEVGDPVNDQDVTNKRFVETSMTSQVVQATAKAAEALASQVAASASQVAAAGSASAAATSETNAATSETNADADADAAAASAAAAASSQSDVATKYADFDTKYLGHKATDPTLDNQGAALVDGQLYFNTTNDLMMVRVSGAWHWIGSDPGTSVLASSIVFDAANVGTSETDGQALLEGIIKGTALNDGSIADSKLATTFFPVSGGTITGDVYVAGDVYTKHNGKNENGLIFQRADDTFAAYLLHDDATDQIRLNTYNAAGAYTGNPVAITEDGASVTFNASTHVNSDTLRVGGGGLVNQHLYFRQGSVDRALLYNHANSSSLQFNMYNSVGTIEGSAHVSMVGGRSRYTAGDFYATSGLYYGPRTNNAAVIQNEYSNLGTFFRDIHYLGYIGGTGGPTTVSLVGANAANNLAGYNFCDVWSDVNIKDNIRPTEVDALKELNALTVVGYDWNENAKTAFGPGLDVSKRVDIGLIAQDVETLDPSLVTKMKAHDEEDEFLMINKKEMVPHLIRAIQQLSAKVDELEAKLEAAS